MHILAQKQVADAMCNCTRLELLNEAVHTQDAVASVRVVCFVPGGPGALTTTYRQYFVSLVTQTAKACNTKQAQG